MAVHDDEIVSDDYVFSFFSNNLKGHLGDSRQGKYLIKYLRLLNGNTCVLEDRYIDKDYMIDYQKFYSRSFGDDGKFTKRIHFFTEEFSKEEFKKSLENNNLRYLNDEKYLGFVVIRPITDEDNEPLIGRTLLKAYPPEEEGDKRIFITRCYNVSLFGLPLKIRSLPFQAQDQGVSACATIALWSALHPLGATFGIPRLSPSEITEISTSFPLLSHKFPSMGLTWDQMVNCVRSMGLDVETIGVKSDDAIQTAVTTYIDAGLPLIAALELINRDNQAKLRHAVVVSGYRCDCNNNLKEMYVHDDGIGPYSRVDFGENFKEWNNEWSIEFSVTLEKLLVPIYPKIRLPFWRMYSLYQDLKTKIINSDMPNYDLRLCLTSVRRYKKFLLKKSIYEKEKVLTQSLPRFIWIIRAYDNDKPKYDLIYDGISLYPRKFLTRIVFI